MGDKKLHYKMYKDGKKFVFAAIATLSFFVFGGVSTVAVHADTTTAATVNNTSDMKNAVSSAANVASNSSATKADSTSVSRSKERRGSKESSTRRTPDP